ncbi:MAG: iron ABC transporter permease, partial [Candidatus Methanomethylophilaceae archaeon]|nr:iron ABC transporter permease [Candidatus Methanomethylophilaceae archaeon]
MLFAGICAALVLILIVLNVSIGLYKIGFLDSYRVLIDHLSGVVPDNLHDIREDHIIFNQRLPRAIAAACVGAVLAVSGAAMQSTLKNPLADPYTTGISSGASFGVCIFAVMGISLLPGLSGDYGMIANAFVFSLIPAGAIIVCSRVFSASPTSVILIGIAVMYVFSACTTLIKLYAEPEDLEVVYRWSLGNLGKATWDNIGYMAASAVIASVFMTAAGRRLNILTMND